MTRGRGARGAVLASRSRAPSCAGQEPDGMQGRRRRRYTRTVPGSAVLKGALGRPVDLAWARTGLPRRRVFGDADSSRSCATAIEGVRQHPWWPSATTTGVTGSPGTARPDPPRCQGHRGTVSTRRASRPSSCSPATTQLRHARVAAEVGIDEVRAELLPEDKVDSRRGAGRNRTTPWP